MTAFLSRACLVLALAAGTACTEGGAATASPGKSTAAVTVNGVGIAEAEVQLALKPALSRAEGPTGHGNEASVAERRKGVLAGLVRDELARQRAVELGLAPEGAAADEVARLETLLSGAKRKALAEAYFTRQVLKKAEPTEQEARAYFEANGAVLRTEFHVNQLLLRDEAQITQLQGELAAGVPFVEVARRQFPNLPEGVGQPWDLGFLSWRQLPEQWRPVLEKLPAGEVSPIIRGPGGRFWLVHLVERRAKSEVTFEEVRPMIVEDLKRARLEQLTAQAEQDLRKSARIEERP